MQCCSCKVSDAHPAYGDRCEDCYVDQPGTEWLDTPANTGFDEKAYELCIARDMNRQRRIDQWWRPSWYRLACKNSR